MQKPPPCYQNWDAMKEVPGGRLCKQCNNTIVDFTMTTWDDILAQQKESHYSTCGKYSDKQIRHWGHQPPAIDMRWFHKFSITSLFMLLGLKSADAQITNDVEIEIVEKTNDGEVLETLDSVWVEYKGRVIDSLSGEPVPYSTIRIKNRQGGTYADEYGNFSIKIKQVTVEKQNLLVKAEYVGLSKDSILLHSEIMNVILFTKDDRLAIPPVAYFRVAEPTLKSKLLKPLRRIGSWFRRD